MKDIDWQKVGWAAVLLFSALCAWVGATALIVGAMFMIGIL